MLLGPIGIIFMIFMHTDFCNAMDHQAESLTLSTIPEDLQIRILEKVCSNNLNDIDDLATLRHVSRHLQSLFSNENVLNKLLKIDKVALQKRFFGALDTLNPMRVQWLHNLGATWDKDTTLIYTIGKTLDHPQAPEINARLLTIIGILETAGASWKTIEQQKYIFQQLISKNAVFLIKLFLTHGKKVCACDILLAGSMHSTEVKKLLGC